MSERIDQRLREWAATDGSLFPDESALLVEAADANQRGAIRAAQ